MEVYVEPQLIPPEGDGNWTMLATITTGNSSWTCNPVDLGFKDKASAEREAKSQVDSLLAAFRLLEDD